MSESNCQENGQIRSKDGGVPSESMHEILPRLYLGDLKAAVEVEVLRSKNISCVLSIRRGNLICATRKAYQKAQISHIYIDKLDQPQEDLVSMFEPVCDMIEGRLTKDKAVLVHCTLGRSRSATVVIAYVMRHMNMNCVEAMNFVQGKRAQVDPNSGFRKQLKMWEKCEFDFQKLHLSHREPQSDPVGLRSLIQGKKRIVREKKAIGQEQDCTDGTAAKKIHGENKEKVREGRDEEKDGIPKGNGVVASLSEAAYISNELWNKACYASPDGWEVQDANNDPATDRFNHNIDTAAEESASPTPAPEVVRDIIKTLYSRHPGMDNEKLIHILNRHQGWNIGSEEFGLHLEAIVAEQSANDAATGIEGETASSKVP